ncbi:1513_t:CDS:1, partial [Dentiscutata erythropus]
IYKSKHSYLYTDPYEPIVHGTFGIDQYKFWYIIDKLSDFFAEIKARSRGFGHPDYDG